MAKLRATIDPEGVFAAIAPPPTGLSAAAEDAMPSSVILEDKHGSAT
jgi:hypothetical protein